MSMEREGEPVLNSWPHADTHNRTVELQAKLDHLRVGISRQKELNEMSNLEKGDPYGAETSKIMGEMLDTFFEFVTKPLENDLKYNIVVACTECFMLENHSEYSGEIEDAIDTALQEVIDEATTPHATGLLAIARYRIQTQRRQLAGG